jgi:uncharacterized protein YigE (DUF2233 family)
MVKRVLTVEDYITQSGPVLEKNGFFEKEIHRKCISRKVRRGAKTQR